MMIYGYNTISPQSISDVSSDPNKMSHSWKMGKQIKTTKKDS